MTVAIDYVRLSALECQAVALVGVLRHVDSLFERRRPGRGTQRDGWSDDIHGALGEYVVAKFLGLHWPLGMNGAGSDDVGKYEVKATARPDGSLIVPVAESKIRPYVLVICDPPLFRLPGWYWSDEAKTYPIKQQDGRDPAHFVPQGVLRAMDTLRHDAY